MTAPAITLPPVVSEFAEALSRGDFAETMPASTRERLLDTVIGLIVAAKHGDGATVRQLAAEVLDVLPRRAKGDLPHDLAKLLASLEPEGAA